MKNIRVKLNEIELVILMEALNHYEKSAEFQAYKNKMKADIFSLHEILKDKLKIVCCWSFKYIINRIRQEEPQW